VNLSARQKRIGVGWFYSRTRRIVSFLSVKSTGLCLTKKKKKKLKLNSTELFIKIVSSSVMKDSKTLQT